MGNIESHWREIWKWKSIKNRISEKQQLNRLNYIHLILFLERRKLAERTYIKPMIKRKISLGSAFTVLEGASYTWFWDKGPQGPYQAKDPACYNTDLPGKLNLCNNGKMIWGVTNDFLIGFEACFTVGFLNYHIYVHTQVYAALNLGQKSFCFCSG